MKRNFHRFYPLVLNGSMAEGGHVLSKVDGGNLEGYRIFNLSEHEMFIPFFCFVLAIRNSQTTLSTLQVTRASTTPHE